MTTPKWISRPESTAAAGSIRQEDVGILAMRLEALTQESEGCYALEAKESKRVEAGLTRNRGGRILLRQARGAGGARC